MYIKNNIHFKRRDDLENNHIENIWVEVQSLKNKFLLGLFYRPPNATIEYWDNLEDVIENTSEENLDIIIMGDFNHDTLKANIHSPLLRTLTKFNLQNLITEPTSVTNASSKCINLIITNHHAIITDTNVLSVFESTAYLKFAKLQYVSSGFRCRVITGSLMRLY